MSAKRQSHHPHPASGFMSRRQVAEEFGFSIGYLNLLPKSELPFFKRGSKVFYERATVIAWIKGQISAPGDLAQKTKSRGKPKKPVLKEKDTPASSV